VHSSDVIQRSISLTTTMLLLLLLLQSCDDASGCVGHSLSNGNLVAFVARCCLPVSPARTHADVDCDDANATRNA